MLVIGDTAPSIADPADGPLTPAQQVLLANVAQGLVRFDARGQIEPGLAERWNVSDDGLSYVFRLGAGDWPDGRAIHARDVARLLTRTLRRASRNPLKDTLGAVDEVVAMTDRVIEIRLSAPRPNLLQLLAQPEMALTREGHGTGPFQPTKRTAPRGAVALLYSERVIDGPDKRDLVDLASAPTARADRRLRQGRGRSGARRDVRRFAAGPAGEDRARRRFDSTRWRDCSDWSRRGQVGRWRTRSCAAC